MNNKDDFGDKIKIKLKKCSENVQIFPLAKIVNPQNVEIEKNSMIDDFTFINGGQELKIGKYVHIASFVSITGGGKLHIGDYVVLACGVRIITGTDTYHNGKRMSSALPLEERNLLLGESIIERDAFIGTNVIVHPNVTIGEGAVIGSGSLVLKNVEPWSINVGNPSKKIGNRPLVNY
jgi:acetyltransferase-like isoleucine patch superfamily enzyme